MTLDNIELDKEDKSFLYIQLYEKIKEMILDGRLKHETKLPTIRALAQSLDVNNITIVNSYNKLEEEGYIYKKVGSGSYVKKLDQTYDDDTSCDTGDDKVINFASTAPTPNLFPMKEIKESIIEVLDKDNCNAFTYQDPKGFPPLRKSLRDYLRGLGIYSNEDSIQIISGAQQGIDIISKALIDYEDIVFVEEFTYTGAIGVFNSRGASTVGIKLENNGLSIQDLEEKLKFMKPKFLYLMPNFHNPTGCSYSLSKMENILELAHIYNFYIIEDDYLSDLEFMGHKNITMKSLDTGKKERVIYIKSFSKLFMPGLRIAFIVIPDELSHEVSSAKHISDISTPGLIQRSFNTYMRKGEWDQNLKRVNRIYDLRHRIMTNAIETYMPKEIEYNQVDGGFNFWFKLPDGYLSDDLYEYLMDKGIIIAPGKIFDINDDDYGYFRLSVTSMDSDEIEESMILLTEEIKKFLKKDNRSRLTVEDYNKFL